MRRKLLLVLVCVSIVVLTLPFHTFAQKSDPKPPMMLGVNYYVEFWKPEPAKVLSQLPLSIVRWGGDQSDTTISNDMLAYTFAELMQKQHAQPLYQISFLRS